MEVVFLSQRIALVRMENHCSDLDEDEFYRENRFKILCRPIVCR
jgi:hypothetical protein